MEPETDNGKKPKRQRLKASDTRMVKDAKGKILFRMKLSEEVFNKLASKANEYGLEPYAYAGLLVAASIDNNLKLTNTR